MLYQKRIISTLKATLPGALAHHIPAAPPAYEHNQKHGIPMIHLNLN